MQNEAWLENRAGDRTLLQGSCVLGRASDAAVVINDPKVSRRHAMIHEQAEGEFCLIDLGSANGTRLNKRRIGQPTRLADGDVIEVAQYTFTFHQPTNRPHTPFPR
jgi:adenylate cyclase